jgi:hypothetical protein
MLMINEPKYISTIFNSVLVDLVNMWYQSSRSNRSKNEYNSSKKKQPQQQQDQERKLTTQKNTEHCNNSKEPVTNELEVVVKPMYN